jgi:hypothetical protein
MVLPRLGRSSRSGLGGSQHPVSAEGGIFENSIDWRQSRGMGQLILGKVENFKRRKGMLRSGRI